MLCMCWLISAISSQTFVVAAVNIILYLAAVVTHWFSTVVLTAPGCVSGAAVAVGVLDVVLERVSVRAEAQDRR